MRIRFFLLSVAFLFSCESGDEFMKDAGILWPEAARIRAARVAQNEAIAARDRAGILRHWTPDIVVTASRGSVAIGAENYLASLSATFDRFADAVYVRTPNNIESSSHSHLALEEGNWVGTWTDGEVSVRITGSYMAQWRLDDDEWRIRSEVFVATQCDGCEDPGGDSEDD